MRAHGDFWKVAGWIAIALGILLGVAAPVRAEESEGANDHSAVQAEADEPTLTLLTVGPGSDMLELWGHSALCVSSGEFEKGVCYDYGWSPALDVSKLIVGTLSGERLFVPTSFPAERMLAVYQFRDVWKQKLELTPEQTEKLLARLRADVNEERAYAYEPVFDNCTTRLRDVVDEVTSGTLRKDSEASDGAPLRSFAEEGLRGRWIPLAALALGGGARLDRKSSEWERMAFPIDFMDSVEKRLNAPKERLFTRLDAPPPTSVHAGRVALLVLSGGLALFIWRAKKTTLRAKSGLVGLWLAFLSLVPLAALSTSLPSLTPNWTLLLLPPTDLLFFARPGQILRRYGSVRAGSSLLLGLLSALGLIEQSLVAVSLVALLPLGALALRLKQDEGGQNGRARAASSSTGS
ncbi:MAG: hypothetical protein B6A08_00095 [Sorangiineae bacterium NIC37A_2]|jgi:hypothetical protein|nr:MAG: hypothetical protein B6A08_00095 [Sorangiineae bacterium NIC37A_2]